MEVCSIHTQSLTSFDKELCEKRDILCVYVVKIVMYLHKVRVDREQ